MKEIIDLHMHSTFSDGSDTPEELLAHVREAGLVLFSLTDHDALNGCGEVQKLLQPEDPAFLTGVEFSCRDERGNYHILGYHYRPDGESILETVEKGHRLRLEKVQARLDFIAEKFGFVFPEEEIRELFAMNNPGKPHIALLMVKHGYAETKEQAIREYIDQLHLDSAYIRPEEAIRGILGSGGIPVLAHPFFGNGDDLIVGEQMKERLEYLIVFGLQGVEAFYSGFPPKLNLEMLALAHHHHLFVTAGSDYHGKNKLIPLGQTGLSRAPLLPKEMSEFLEAVGIEMGKTGKVLKKA